MPDVPLRPDPFIPRAAPGALEDLRARLRATRWPDAPEDADWSLGTDLAYLRELVAYWADGFDWPAQEAALARDSCNLIENAAQNIQFRSTSLIPPDRRPGWFVTTDCAC